MDVSTTSTSRQEKLLQLLNGFIKANDERDINDTESEKDYRRRCSRFYEIAGRKDGKYYVSCLANLFFLK